MVTVITIPKLLTVTYYNVSYINKMYPEINDKMKKKQKKKSKPFPFKNNHLILLNCKHL